MKLNISNFQTTRNQTTAQPLVRFAVSIVEDEEPVWTMYGFLFTSNRRVKPPSARGAGSNFIKQHDISEEILDGIRDALMEEWGEKIEAHLGPMVGYDGGKV